MSGAMPTPPAPLRTECPPGSCVCGRSTLEQAGAPADQRVLLLTRAEEQRLLQRLERIASLAELRHLQKRLLDQLGMRLSVRAATHEVRSLRGIAITLHEQPGLCRKTRQAVPAAVRRSLEQRPEIAWALLDEGGLFAGDG